MSDSFKSAVDKVAGLAENLYRGPDGEIREKQRRTGAPEPVHYSSVPARYDEVERERYQCGCAWITYISNSPVKFRKSLRTHLCVDHFAEFPKHAQAIFILDGGEVV